MQTIQAMVNPRLLTKANRLFTGTLQGRIIEILQNARRANATRVEITNQDGNVTVHDNGKGIEDFSKLLDMGGSGWNDALEQSEDPAGVGLFCLTPKAVTIRSNGRMVVVSGDGWTGKPVEIQDDPNHCTGTCLRFQDEPWKLENVEPHAVFSGIEVVVDSQVCQQLPFVSDQAADHPELGCKIEVMESDALEAWHRTGQHGGHYSDNVLVNFHGQVVSMDYKPVAEHHLHYMVDLTGAPTGIRLMLPARTRLVENGALLQLKAAMELEAYRYLQQRGRHRLPYQGYLRAQQLGVHLPESEPVYNVGVLYGETPEPIEVNIPEQFPLAKCYRHDPTFEGAADTDEANIHLLGALGTFESPFVPVRIDREYDGYSWAKLPTIGRVEVEMGDTLQESYIWSGELICVESLSITVHTSDGQVFKSPVCMAIQPEPDEDKPSWRDQPVLVTPAAEQRLVESDIWYHLGGWNDNGDSYDTQEATIAEELNGFWARLLGPYEQIRRKLLDELGSIKDWKQVTLSTNGTLEIVYKNGKREMVKPPRPKKTNK